ncbi:uncharacterized protein LOC111628561 [Centruroides sculpturatus]|uniref:uncharacterized protein LOC111628561 n=1 Tax=Centruroides sculpturatus TaxID=218467 RepID=UPI000C6DCD55|nr:uncharacterized protein LOC111628561 [Centruroides sculpturatus]
MNFKSHIVHNNIDNIPNEFNFMTDPKATHPYEISLDFKELTENKKKRQLIAFTDGSKGENGVGSGVVVKNSEGRTLYQAAFKLADHCSITQAELWGIFKALTYISQLSHTTYKELLVFTDSRAALHILRRENNKSALAKELINLATKLGKQLKISFNWIPGHAGHAGNELADKLAKKASIAQTKITYWRLPISSITKYINQQICALWQTEWEESPTGRLCFKFFPSIEDRQKNRIFKPSFQTTQCLTGHGCFNSYLRHFKKRDYNHCDANTNNEDTVHHFLFECTKYTTLRENFKRDMYHRREKLAAKREQTYNE